MTPTERQDRHGIVLLIILLTLVSVAVWWAATPTAPQQHTSSKETKHTATPTKHDKAQRDWQLRLFDPNTASADELREIGFSEYHVRNLLRYRSKGGRWRSVAHFQKLYGLSEEDYTRLRPYLLLPQETPSAPYTNEHSTPTTTPATATYPTADKLKAGERIDLSTADTTQLKRIPGIGSTYAKRIVRYRDALGGFVHVDQLSEVPDLPPEVTSYTYLSDTQPQRLSANTATYGQLLHHPYLNDTLVRAIINYRQQYGSFRSLPQLLKLLPATPAERERLRPYLRIDD